MKNQYLRDNILRYLQEYLENEPYRADLENFISLLKRIDQDMIEIQSESISPKDRDAISELVHEYLVDKGIKTEYFAWDIQVYFEIDEEDE